MTSYTAHFEIDVSPTENRTDSLLDALAAWSPAVGRSDHGRLEGTVTFEAPTVWKAIGLARETFEGIVPDPIRFELLPTAVFDRRSDEGDEDREPIGVNEAAMLLDLSRQRVLQMIHEGKLDATSVGRSWAIKPTSVENYVHKGRKTVTEKKNVHTVSTDKGWANRREGAQRASSVHATKAEAEAAGRAAARKDSVEHLIHRKDGTIGERNSYGNDPHPPKG